MTKRAREDWSEQLRACWKSAALPTVGEWTHDTDTLQWEAKAGEGVEVSMSKLEHCLSSLRSTLIRSVTIHFRKATLAVVCSTRTAKNTEAAEFSLSVMSRRPILQFASVADAKRPMDVPFVDWSKLDDISTLIGKLQGSATPADATIVRSVLKDKYALTCTGFASMDMNDLRALLRAYRVDIDDIQMSASGFVVTVWAERHARPQGHMWVSEGVHTAAREDFDAKPSKRARTDSDATMTIALGSSSAGPALCQTKG